MYYLRIKKISGELQTIPLRQDQPVLIGRHQTADVRVDEEGVHRLHARVAWRDDGYEIAAATPDGVEVNGARVRRWKLTPQDIVRVGSAEIRLVLEKSKKKAASAPPPEKPKTQAASPTSSKQSLLPDEEELELIVLSDEDEPTAKPATPAAPPGPPKAARTERPAAQRPAAPKQPERKPTAEAKRKAKPSAATSEPPAPPKPEKPAAKPAAQPKPAEPERAAVEERRAERGPATEKKPEAAPAGEVDQRPAKPADEPAELAPAGPPSMDFLFEEVEPAPEAKRAQQAPAEDWEEQPSEPAQPEPVLAGGRRLRRRPGRELEAETELTWLRRLLVRFGIRPVRPGEEDVVRSPIVLSLSTLSVILLLVATIFWFIIQRQVVQQQFDAAKKEYDQGHFAQAVALFEQFLVEHPRHKYAQQVLVLLGRAKIEKEILGATPSWKNGLKALQDFIDQHRDQPYFDDLRDDVAKYARSIAFGALKTAAATKNRSLIEVSDNAALIFSRYAPEEPPPEQVQAQLKALREQTEAVILKWETLQAALNQMKASLQQQKPLEALVARRNLLARYPDLESDRQVVQLLRQTLETARALVAQQPLDQPAVATDPSAAAPTPLTLVTHTRGLSGETSDGELVFVRAKGCLFGVDRVTGLPVWRRVVGLDQPFFPVRVQTAKAAALLVYDSNRDELVLLEQHTGKLLWRQRLEEPAVGRPVVLEGQVYQATEGAHIFKLELETGRLTGRMDFPQPIHAPPVLLSDNAHLVVAADEALLYVLTLRPFACVSVSLLGHKPGSLSAPLVAMGKLLLVPENVGTDQCTLRVLDASRPEDGLVEREDARVTLGGQCRDEPVLRGNVLFVPLTGERVAAFTVSDEPGQPALTLIGRHTVETSHPGRVFLMAGPDGQMWMAGSALRRFQLKTNNIALDPNLVAEGVTTQPLQSYANYLFIARQRPHSTATWLVKVDREARPVMSGLWRTILGARILTATPAGSDTLLCLTEEGSLFHLSSAELKKGGFRVRTDGQIQFPKDMAEPARAVVLPDGQLALATGLPEPTLWILNAQGQIRREIPLEEPLQSDPIALGQGLILPLVGKLGYQLARPGRLRIEGYTAPIDREAEPPRWVGGAALSGNEAVVVDSRGTLLKIQYRTSPTPHLYEAAKVSLGSAVDFPPVVWRETVLVADSAGRLRALHRSNFDPLTEVQLPAPPSGPLRLLDDRLLVEAGGSELLCFRLGQRLEKLWSVPLKGLGLADAPLLTGDGRLVLAERSGRVAALDLQTGRTVAETTVEQPIDLGPRSVGDQLYVATIDGSLYRVVLQTQ